MNTENFLTSHKLFTPQWEIYGQNFDSCTDEGEIWHGGVDLWFAAHFYLKHN